MKTVGHLIRKEFLQLKRDRRMLAIVFVAPVLQLLLLGYAANLDVRDIPTVICDLDRSPQSRRLVSDFVHSGYFEPVAYLDRHTSIDGWIDRGKAEVALVIPADFGCRLLSGEPADLQVVTDGSNSSSATIGLGYAAVIVNRYDTREALEAPERIRIHPRIRVWYNPELKSRYFMVPGILALLLLVMSMLLTSLAIVKEKEMGTLEQLIVTPITPSQLILGKLTPFVIISFLDVALVLLVARFFFGLPLRGSVLLLLALSGLFLLSTLGLGLLISTLSRNQKQAMMSSVFFVMLPMLFLSGFVFPVENMPRVIRYLSYLLPLRYYLVIVRGLFLKGVGLAELWDEALILLAFGLVLLGTSALRFRKRLE